MVVLHHCFSHSTYKDKPKSKPRLSAKERDDLFTKLAKPKPLPEGFIEDRRSVYWVDKLPPQPPTVFDISPRLAELVKPKKYHSAFVPDRPHPMWKVSKAALNSPGSERCNTLAIPKPYNKYFIPDRPTPPYPVSKAALNHVASGRITDLATPKRRKMPHFDTSDVFWEGKTWYDYPPVTFGALTYTPSDRLEMLAQPKSVPSGFVPDRRVHWAAPPGLHDIQASGGRIVELAQPRLRMNAIQDYDPYSVSPAALNAVATSRLADLAMPIKRQQSNF